VLVDKYGSCVNGLVGTSSGSSITLASQWWRDLVNLEGEGGVRWLKKNARTTKLRGAYGLKKTIMMASSNVH